ncbi:hypothetical protein Tco_0508962, partial [Tanacetum coccineum]
TLSFPPRKRRLSSNVTDVNQDLLSKRRTTCAENVSSPNNHLHSTADPSIPPTDTSVNHAHHTELQWDDVECAAIDKYLYCWKAAGFTADPLGSSALWTLQIRLDLMLHGCFRVLMYK